ncbi:MAG: ABC transporter permease subunit [Verrucomicrobiota bacterium]|jgi:hypothetical protein|nr:ABC transporter permease subunit [Verrucomicrobiota bacterium]
MLSIRPIFAIAQLALRNTFRSRIVLLLLMMLAGSVLLLPTAVRSDGTVEGLIRLHLSYTLGLALFLLTLATLWAGCSSVSQEADAKTLHLLLVKPVPRFQIWLGKWLALVVLDFVLLAFVMGLSLGTLHWKLHRWNADPADLRRGMAITLASLETRYAPLPDVEARVEEETERLQAETLLPDLPEDILRGQIRRAILTRLYSIPPNESHTWRFELPSHHAEQPLPLIQFRCASSILGAAEIHATVSMADLHTDLRLMPGTLQTVYFPKENPTLSGAVDVTVLNHGEQGATLFFEPVDGLVLRQPHGTFAGNYARGFFQLFLRLSLFAALGVTLGTLFTLPVATFLTLVLLLLMSLFGFVSEAAQTDRETFVEGVASFGAGSHSHGEEEVDEDPSALARGTATILYYVYRGTYLTLGPFLENTTLDRLTTATRIPPGEIGRNLLQQGLLLPLLLGLASTFILRRREWALPTRS